MPPPFYRTRPSFGKLPDPEVLRGGFERLNGESIKPFSSISDSPAAVKKIPDSIAYKNIDNDVKNE
jgi:hypothetical protein